MKTLETGELQEVEHTETDGQSFIRRCSPVLDISGEVTGVVLIVFNITDRKQTEAGLKTANEFLQSLLENSPTPIFISGADGQINTVNRAWETMFGFAREQTIGRQFHDVFQRKQPKGSIAQTGKS